VNIGQIDAGREELVGGAHPKKINQKNGAWAFSLFAPLVELFFKVVVNHPIHFQCFNRHASDDRIAVSPWGFPNFKCSTTPQSNTKTKNSEYHHDRHLVLFALLDWFLIPGPIRDWPTILSDHNLQWSIGDLGQVNKTRDQVILGPASWI